MNREIKFRAWDKEYNKMLVTDTATKFELSRSGVDVYSYEEIHTDISGVDRTTMDWVLVDAIPMQFTGLTDKHGKEIYEGDIYKAGNYMYQVFFISGAFVGGKSIDSNQPLGWGYTEEGLISEGTEMDWLEVIGNIYENPNLLEK